MALQPKEIHMLLKRKVQMSHKNVNWMSGETTGSHKSSLIEILAAHAMFCMLVCYTIIAFLK